MKYFFFHFFLILFSTLFIMSITFSCISLINDRRNGSWNRELLSGVSIYEILIAHFTLHCTVMVIMVTETMIVVFYTMSLDNQGSFLMETILVILVYLAGLFFGLLFSCKIDDYTMAIYMCMGMSIAQIFLTGAIW